MDLTRVIKGIREAEKTVPDLPGQGIITKANDDDFQFDVSVYQEELSSKKYADIIRGVIEEYVSCTDVRYSLMLESSCKTAEEYTYANIDILMRKLRSCKYSAIIASTTLGMMLSNNHHFDHDMKKRSTRVYKLGEFHGMPVYMDEYIEANSVYTLTGVSSYITRCVRPGDGKNAAVTMNVTMRTDFSGAEKYRLNI